MEYRWTYRNSVDSAAVDELSGLLNNLPRALSTTLVGRGITTFDEAQAFFRPSSHSLLDPFLMKDMDRAADRVAEAVQRRERVLVYGDYDVDGTTSAAIMILFLKSLGLETSYFVPHRFEHGYGLCCDGLDKATEDGANLCIALDCGITGLEAADYAKAKGIDLVICDHHKAPAVLPDAVAILDPKRPDCDYPFKELSGAGVGFKLMQAVLQRLGLDPARALEYADLIALSIASDIVPVTSENRVLMIEGLRQIRERPRLGIKTLAGQAKLDLRRCNSGQIVFNIGPRINAAGRVGHARTAVDLLVAACPHEALSCASQLETLNRERRELDLQTLEEAVEMVEHSSSTCLAPALVLYKEDWHGGVIGIVASRIVERYYRPTILLTRKDEMAKGSARSITDVDIYAAIKSCEPMLEAFGGHKYAAGVTLPVDKVDEFRDQLNQYVEDTVDADCFKPVIKVDADLDLTEITPRFWSVLKQFAPFGPENSNPVFKAQHLETTTMPSIVGEGHLKFAVRQRNGSTSRVFQVIGFGKHELLPRVREARRNGQQLEMLFTIDENVYRGQSSLQFKLKDLRLPPG